MRRYILIPAVLLLLLLRWDRAAAGPVGDIELLMGFSAKESCSCVFVVQQTDAFCQAFGQQEGYPPLTLIIDHTAKTVTADAGIGKTRLARATDTGGCTLDAQ